MNIHNNEQGINVIIYIFRSSLLPDNVKDAETRLGQSMETYRQRCDNLGNSLHGLLNKLEDERYFGDLATEVNKLRKLLSDEKKKVGGERHKLGEVHAMFETIYDEYSRTVDSLDAAQRDIQHKVGQFAFEEFQNSYSFGFFTRSNNRSNRQS